jgi:SAM-dependent methyltransferase
LDTTHTPGGELPSTGERCVTSLRDDCAIEHLHRYVLGQSLAGGQSVLDIACGEGYGSYLLAQAARRVVGVDVSADTVTHARQKYRRPNLVFEVGDCVALPLAAGSVDVVVSFETIEHHDRHQEMMREIKRVLRPGGCLFISSPNKTVYSDRTGFKNPFHVKELYREEFEDLLRQHFRAHALFGQLLCDGSVILGLDGCGGDAERSEGDFEAVARSPWREESRYFLAIASDAPALPPVPTGAFDGRRIWATRQHLYETLASSEHQVVQATATAVRLAKTESRLLKTESRLAETESRLAETESRLAETERRRAEAEDRVRSMEQSRSWRMTKVLRTVGRAVRKLKDAGRPAR